MLTHVGVYDGFGEFSCSSVVWWRCPCQMMGGLHVCLSACGFLFNSLLFSLYRLKGLCHQIMFVLGVWWCVNRYMMFCHCDGCALFCSGSSVVRFFCFALLWLVEYVVLDLSFVVFHYYVYELFPGYLVGF